MAWGIGTERVRDQAVQRLHEGGRAAAVGVDANRAAQGDDAAHALRRLVGTVEGEDAAQAPADQAHLAAAEVMQPADLCSSAWACRAGSRRCGRNPRCGRRNPGCPERIQREQRGFVGHEAGQQQHRVAVACGAPIRPGPCRAAGDLEHRPPLGQRIEQAGFALVRVAFAHGGRRVVLRMHRFCAHHHPRA